MNMFKKNGGFTLVELIVVIAILAILAGVAIPAYSGYIEKANNTAVMAELEAVETAAFSAAAMDGLTIDKIVIDYSGAEPAIAVYEDGEAVTLKTAVTTFCDVPDFDNVEKMEDFVDGNNLLTWEEGNTENGGWELSTKAAG